MTSKKAQPKNTLNPLPAIGIQTSSEQYNNDRYCRIAEAAYHKAEARGFEPGYEWEDWFAAEAEVK